MKDGKVKVGRKSAPLQLSGRTEFDKRVFEAIGGVNGCWTYHTPEGKVWKDGVEQKQNVKNLPPVSDYYLIRQDIDCPWVGICIGYLADIDLLY